MQKLKQTLTILALLAFPLSWAGSANAGLLEWLGTNIAQPLLTLITNILGVFVGVLMNALMPLLRGIYDVLVSNPDLLFTEKFELTKQLWIGALTLANGFFLVALIIASVAIILRLNTGTYNIKKVLAGFIAAVVLANLSFYIFQALLEIGNALTAAAYGIFATMGVTSADVQAYIGGLADLRFDISAWSLEQAIFALVIMILIFWVILKIVALLIERMFWLFVMAIIAPAAFALGLLPTTQKLASSWWETVIKWIIAFPLTIALLSLSVAILKSIGSVDHLKSVLTSNFHGVSQFFSNPDGLLLVAGLVVMYLAGTAAKMLKIGGPLTGAIETPQSMIQTGQKAWKGIADTATGKNLPGKLQTYARRGVGSVLDAATKKGGPIANRFPKARNLGTQIGSVPKAVSKIWGGIGKEAERKSKKSAGRGVGWFTRTKLAQKMGWDKDILISQSGDIYGDISTQSSSYPGLDSLKNRLSKVEDPIDFVTTLGVINKFINSQSLPKAERKKVYGWARELVHSNFDGNEDMQRWNNLRLEAGFYDFNNFVPAGGDEPAPPGSDDESGGGASGGTPSASGPAAGGADEATEKSDARMHKESQTLNEIFPQVEAEAEKNVFLEEADEEVNETLNNINKIEQATDDLPEDIDVDDLVEKLADALKEPDTESQQKKALDSAGVNSQEARTDLINLSSEAATSPGLMNTLRILAASSKREGVALNGLIKKLRKLRADVNSIKQRHTQEAVKTASVYQPRIEQAVQKKVETGIEPTVALQSIITTASDQYETLAQRSVREKATPKTKLGTIMNDEEIGSFQSFLADTNTSGQNFLNVETAKQASVDDALRRMRLVRDNAQSMLNERGQ